MVNMEFGTRLKRLIKDKGYNQKGFASKLEINDQTITRWVKGYTAPDAFQIINICKILNIGVSELFADLVNRNEIEKLLNDPLVIKCIELVKKHPPEINAAIRQLLDSYINLASEKRQAILALCK